jgi:Mg-chelatase subunit ChlI/Mg-chelatase subunit ChlD
VAIVEKSALGTPQPFSSTISNEQLKTALFLTLIDPEIGGVLAIGPKGTGKSRTVRTLKHLLPEMPVVDPNCPFSCPPIPQAACDSCTKLLNTQKSREHEFKRKELVYLPISTTEEHLIGGFDVSNAVSDGKVKFRPGLLARANQNILVIEEVNLLPDPLIDVIMSVVDEKKNRIEREGISSQHPVSTIILGTMNREEGELRPHFAERFGLSAFTQPTDDLQARLEIINANIPTLERRESLPDLHAADQQLQKDIQSAKTQLTSIHSDKRDFRFVSLICEELELDGGRVAEILYRAARSLGALRGASSLTSTDFYLATELVSGHRTRKGGELPPPTESEIQDAFQRAIERDRLLTDESDATELERHLSQLREKKKLYDRKRRLGNVRIGLWWLLVLFFILVAGFETIFQFLLLVTPFVLAALILTDVFRQLFLKDRFLGKKDTEELRKTKKTRTYYRESPWPMGLSHPIVGIAALILLPASIHLAIIWWTEDPWTPWGIIPYLVFYIALAIGFSKPRGGKTPLYEVARYEREDEVATEELLSTPAPAGTTAPADKSKETLIVPQIDRDFLFAMQSARSQSPEWNHIYTPLIAHVPDSFRGGASIGMEHRESIFRLKIPPLRKRIRGQTKRGTAGKRAQTITNLSKGRIIGWKTPNEQPKNIHLAATIRQSALRQAKIGSPKHQGEHAKGPFVKIARADIREKRYLWKSRATVVFILDLSRSMELVLKAVQEAILFLHQDAYRKRDRVGLVACRGTEAAVIQYPTTNVNLVAKQIDELAVGGLTPLPSGVLLGQKVLENELRRDRECIPIMVVVSDGGANVPLPWNFRENRPRFLRKTYELWTGDGVRDAVKDLFLVAERIRRAGISTINIVPYTAYDPSSAHGFSAMKGFQEITGGQMFMPSLETLHLVPTVNEGISKAVRIGTRSS